MRSKFNDTYDNNFVLFITIFIILCVVLICVLVGFSKLTNKIVTHEGFVSAPSFK